MARFQTGRHARAPFLNSGTGRGAAPQARRSVSAVESGKDAAAPMPIAPVISRCRADDPDACAVDVRGALPLRHLPSKGRKAFANLHLAPCTTWQDERRNPLLRPKRAARARHWRGAQRQVPAVQPTRWPGDAIDVAKQRRWELGGAAALRFLSRPTSQVITRACGNPGYKAARRRRRRRVASRPPTRPARCRRTASP